MKKPTSLLTALILVLSFTNVALQAQCCNTRDLSGLPAGCKNNG